MNTQAQQDIRWKQRFEHFCRAFSQLETAMKIQNPSDTERAGLIQFFEMSFELAWKVLKDYLEMEGFNVNSPRSAIKQAFQAQFIQDGHVWMEALSDHNLTVHTYSESIAREIEDKIRTTYYPSLASMKKSFELRLEQ